MSRSAWTEPEDRLDALARVVIGAALEVRKTLGPGFAESVYEEALAIELARREVPFERQAPVRVTYKGSGRRGARRPTRRGRTRRGAQSVEALAPIHIAQVISYLRTLDQPLGLLLNFNTSLLRNGIRRIVLTRRS